MDRTGIYCIGRNYLSHISELKNERPTEPVLFLKAPSALRILGHENTGIFPYPEEAFDHELEIVLEVGEQMNLSTTPQWSQIRGIRLGLDLTRRERQTELKSKSLPWTLAKSFKGSALVTELIELKKFVNLDGIAFELQINEQTRQSGNTELMIWRPMELLNFVLKSHELLPGDLVFTGTPSGVGPIRYGDKIVMRLLNENIEFHGVL